MFKEGASHFETKPEALSFEEQFKNISEVRLPNGTGEGLVIAPYVKKGRKINNED